MNVSILIGKLQVMKSYTQDEVSRRYLHDAVSILRYNQTSADAENNQEHIAEVTAALDMMSYKCCRREAEVLRDTVEYLESLDCEVQA